MSSKRAAHHATFGVLKSGILQKTGIDSNKPRRKTPLQLERCVKGIANHHRISILFLLAKQEGMTLDQIVQSLGGNAKTFSEHTQKLRNAGLIQKRYKGNSVEHSLSPYGKRFHDFLKLF